MSKLTVGFVYGGKSGEHEISLDTAFSVMSAVDYYKYDCIPFYITREGTWKTAPPLTAPFENVEQLKLEHEEQGTEKALHLLFSRLTNSGPSIDVMFPLLHGTYGEDGTIQGLFEMADLPYVGADVLVSAVGMDKITMKKLFAQAGIEQTKYRYFNHSQWVQQSHELMTRIEDELGYPCFVKPSNLGSSVGISKVHDRNELQTAIDLALSYDLKVIVERLVDGREVEVGVLGNEDPIASVPGEIICTGKYYGYEEKYTEGHSQMIIPAHMDEEKADEIREAALQAFRTIQGNGIARVDFFIRHSDGAILVNEVNTMPGFTSFSMYPRLWQETGIGYTELLDRMIVLGIKRYNQKKSLQYTQPLYTK